MEKVITNPNRIRKPSVKTGQNSNLLSYDEKFVQSGAVLYLKTKVLAVSIFLFFFIENGTLGLLPRDFYYVYRNVRISDLILYAIIIYSLLNVREYMDMFKSRAFLILKILFAYILFEFILSAITYKFNLVEYFFRLKRLWTTFLVFPFMLLLKRNGLFFLCKLIFPVAVISNILYIMSAVTGVAYMPDVSIITQKLPGNLEVYRVFGGTFFGDMFLLGFIYYWITVRFRLYQLFFATLFIIPHILTFGRATWAAYLFTFFVIVVINSLQKRRIRVLLKQAFIFVILGSAIIFSFMKFIPNSDYYADALEARLFQGGDDVQYNEGTYGVRVLLQNNDLLRLWLKNNVIVGIGMHPMWVYKPDSLEEQKCYSAFSDVTWPAVLAAYGIIGVILAGIFQFYYIKTTFKLIFASGNPNINTFFLVLLFAKLIFDTFVNFSYCLFSFGLIGISSILCLQIAVLVLTYENKTNYGDSNTVKSEIEFAYNKRKYYYSSYKTYKLRDYTR